MEGQIEKELNLGRVGSIFRKKKLPERGKPSSRTRSFPPFCSLGLWAGWVSPPWRKKKEGGLPHLIIPTLPDLKSRKQRLLEPPSSLPE